MGKTKTQLEQEARAKRALGVLQATTLLPEYGAPASLTARPTTDEAPVTTEVVQDPNNLARQFADAATGHGEGQIYSMERAPVEVRPQDPPKPPGAGIPQNWGVVNPNLIEMDPNDGVKPALGMVGTTPTPGGPNGLPAKAAVQIPGGMPTPVPEPVQDPTVPNVPATTTTNTPDAATPEQAKQFADALTTEQQAGTTPGQPGQAGQAGQPGQPSTPEDRMARYGGYVDQANELVADAYLNQAKALSRSLADSDGDGIPDAEEEAAALAEYDNELAQGLNKEKALSAKRMLDNANELAFRKDQYLKGMQATMEYLSKNPVDTTQLFSSASGFVGMAGAAYFDAYYAAKGWNIPSLSAVWKDALERNIDGQLKLLEAGQRTSQGFENLWNKAKSLADTRDEAIGNMKALAEASITADYLRKVAPFKSAAAVRDKAELTAKVYESHAKNMQALAAHFEKARQDEFNNLARQEQLRLQWATAKIRNKAEGNLMSRGAGYGRAKASAGAINMSYNMRPETMELLGIKPIYDKKTGELLNHPLILNTPQLVGGRLVMRPQYLIDSNLIKTEGERKSLEDDIGIIADNTMLRKTMAKISGVSELQVATSRNGFSTLFAKITGHADSKSPLASANFRSQVFGIINTRLKQLSGAAINAEEAKRLNASLGNNLFSVTDGLIASAWSNLSEADFTHNLKILLSGLDHMEARARQRLVTKGGNIEIPTSKPTATGNKVMDARNTVLWNEFGNERYEKPLSEGQLLEASDAITTEKAQALPGTVSHNTNADSNQAAIDELVANKQLTREQAVEVVLGKAANASGWLIGSAFKNDAERQAASQLVAELSKKKAGATFSAKPLVAALAAIRTARDEGQQDRVDSLTTQVNNTVDSLAGGVSEIIVGKSDLQAARDKVAKVFSEMNIPVDKANFILSFSAYDNVVDVKKAVADYVKSVVKARVDSDLQVESLNPFDMIKEMINEQ